MEARYSLCPACDACPEVIMTEEGVTIGEAGNLVRLRKEDWNQLVDAVLRGDLAKVETDDRD